MHAENPANAPKSYQSPKANKPTSVSTCNTEHIVSNYFLKGLSPLLKSEFLGMYKKEKLSFGNWTEESLNHSFPRSWLYDTEEVASPLLASLSTDLQDC